MHNLDNLLEYGETLVSLGDDLLEADKENMDVQDLKEVLDDSLSDLYDAKDKREEIEDLNDDINNDPDIDDDTIEEKESDREIAESDAGDMINDAETGYEESLKQALIIETEYNKENYPVI